MTSIAENYCVYFSNDSGQSFGLSVIGYKYPDEELSPTGDNPIADFDVARFLMVKTDWNDGDRKWSVTESFFTTVDFQNFSDWLHEVAEGTGNIGVPFTERDLEITADRQQKVVSVHVFSRCLHPATVADTIQLDFPICAVDFESILESLKVTLAKFPSRPHLA